MLEILLVIFISKKIAAQLKEKGRSPTGYVVLFVLLWFGGEITGGIFGAVLTASQAHAQPAGGLDLTIYLFALVGAAIGALIGYAIASSVPPLHKQQWDEYDQDDGENRYRKPGYGRSGRVEDDLDEPNWDRGRS